jgi:hypothetical protein
VLELDHQARNLPRLGQGTSDLQDPFSVQAGREDKTEPEAESIAVHPPATPRSSGRGWKD